MVRLRAPPALLLALKFETALAPVKFKPPTLVVVRVVARMEPEPLSLWLPVVVRVTLLLPTLIPPVMFKLPLLFTVKSPLPVCVTPVIFKRAVVLVKLIAPVPLLLALKPDTVLAAVKLWPLTVLVVNKPPLLIWPAPVSLRLPVLLILILLPPALMAPFTCTLPVLLIVSAPLPLWLMPVIVKG